jgi:hypothetical protein
MSRAHKMATTHKRDANANRRSRYVPESIAHAGGEVGMRGRCCGAAGPRVIDNLSPVIAARRHLGMRNLTRPSPTAGFPSDSAGPNIAAVAGGQVYRV